MKDAQRSKTLSETTTTTTTTTTITPTTATTTTFYLKTQRITDRCAYIKRTISSTLCTDDNSQSLNNQPVILQYSKTYKILNNSAE